MIEKSQKYSNNINFIGLTKVDESIRKNKGYLNKNITKLDNILKDICNKKKVNYIKILNLVDEALLADGLHPNNYGHEKICKEIMNSTFY